MSTRDKLITEAALLLDKGGDPAVTLRAVGLAVGVSHNAPYRHFADRNALLAAVAERDFEALAGRFEEARAGHKAPFDRMERALLDLVAWSETNPARYRLLFSNPEIGATGGALEAAALRAFGAFVALVEDAIAAKTLPATSPTTLAGLIYAATHGLIDLASGGRMRAHKGFTTVTDGVVELLTLLRSQYFAGPN